VITDVDPSGAAGQVGLRQGDVIHRFGRSVIRNAEDLSTAVSAAQAGSAVVLQVERGGRMVFVTVELGGQ